MIKMKKVFYATLFLVVFLSSCVRVVDKDAEIKVVKIGSQFWMSKNLDVDKFRNGDIIKRVNTANEWLLAESKRLPVWGYYQNDSAKYAKYGKLYNWYAVNDKRGLAPVGFHIPKNEEWDALVKHLGVTEAGKKMKSSSGWDNDGNGTNLSGFKGLPGGNVGANAFYGIGNWGYWWSATEDNSEFAWYLGLCSSNVIVEHARSYKDWGLSVRCIKD
jgi:uncharacterized protein (TIGR02145 family)